MQDVQYPFLFRVFWRFLSLSAWPEFSCISLQSCVFVSPTSRLHPDPFVPPRQLLCSGTLTVQHHRHRGPRTCFLPPSNAENVRQCGSLPLSYIVKTTLDFSASHSLVGLDWRTGPAGESEDNQEKNLPFSSLLVLSSSLFVLVRWPLSWGC